MRTVEMSENAWHLKMVRWFDDYYKPESVCGYFWKVLWSMLLTVVTCGTGLMAVFILLAPITAFISYIVMGSMLVPIAPICLGLLLWMLIFLAIMIEKIKDYKQAKENSTEPLGLFGEFWNNFRDKTCTKITLK